MRREHWYLVTFYGLRKKPFTTGIYATSPKSAATSIRAAWHVTEIIEVRRREPAMAPLEAAVDLYLENPKRPGALARLRRALRKEVG